jgi:hypothetical protein
MAAPLICVYCHKSMACHRDHSVPLPPEYPATGDYRPAHAACAKAHTPDVDAHPAAGNREPIRDPFEILSLTQRAAYCFALVVPRVVPSAVRRGLALFRLWLPGQAPQDGVVLTLPELTAFYEDLGRLLEYLQRERHARSPSPSSPPGEGGAHP